MAYTETEKQIEVPKNSGVAGFLRAIESILKLPRVQDVRIDARGRIAYRYFALEGQDGRGAAVEFEDLLPYAVVRNGEIEELLEADESAGLAVTQLFHCASTDRLYPIAFVSGAHSTFWLWYSTTTGLTPAGRDELFGLPFLSDRQFEDNTLFLLAGFERAAPVADTRKSYKLIIPKVTL